MSDDARDAEDLPPATRRQRLFAEAPLESPMKMDAICQTHQRLRKHRRSGKEVLNLIQVTGTFGLQLTSDA
jgi:hypothetical protein